MKTPEARPIALIGLMGAGKSAVARALGERLGVSVADLDGMIEAVEGCSVAELFERAGEAWFRRREGELLADALASGVRVVACGGGVVLDPERRRLLRERCRVVWLEVSPEAAAQRFGVRVRPRAPPHNFASSAPAERPAALRRSAPVGRETGRFLHGLAQCAGAQAQAPALVS